MHINQVLMTPEMAEKILRNNTGNRATRQSHVKILSSAIKSGEWALNHQPIAVSNRGRLLDGQHRLMAIVDAGSPVNVMLATGVDESTFDTIDIGVKRSMSDIFSVNSTVSAVVSNIALIHKAYGGKITPREMEKYFSVFGSKVSDFYEYAPTARAVLASAPIRAACFIRGELSGDIGYCYPQMRALSTANFNDMSPIVRSMASQLMGSTKMNRLDVFVRASYAFNHKNEESTKLIIRDRGKILSDARSAIDAEFARVLGRWIK